MILIQLRLELFVELEHDLNEEAKRRGISMAEYTLTEFTAGLATERRPTTDTELVAFWREEGLIGSRSNTEDTIV